MDYYTILGVSRDASTKEINLAYKKLALKHHPDKTRGDDDSYEQFQQIQEAVETLRDPDRRSKHDQSLGLKKRRYRYPEDDWRTWFDDGTSWGRKKRWDFNNPWDRYMYSFGNSVHMDPDSEESKAERARHSAAAEEWEQTWAGIDPEVEKAKEEAKEERRREAMKVRVMRDEEELEQEEDDDVSVDQTTEFESTAFCILHGNNCHCHEEDGEHSFDKTKDNADIDTDDEDAIFFDCSTSLVDSVVSDDETSQTGETPPEEEQGPLGSLASFFNAKLNKSGGRYTTDDYYTELKGIVLETFCGWMEDLRVSYPDAEPLAMRNDHHDCPHLGAWEKKLGCPECEVCHLWMPSYVLTCSSCGAKACIRCKFMDRSV